MNGLSLCAGVGGLDLGVEVAFENYRCIAAVENNPQAALRFRLRFPKAKVFEDVVGFDGRRLNGIVDCVVAGWPCQPHSVAGKRQGTADERWIWADIARILDESGAGIFFGENVSGLLRDTGSDADAGDLDDESEDVMGGFGTVLRDLAALGFLCVWGSLRASDVGASHGRPRVFVLAFHPERGNLADLTRGGLGIDWSAPGEPGHADERNGGLGAEEIMAYSGCSEVGRHQDTHRIAGRGPSDHDCRASRDVDDPEHSERRPEAIAGGCGSEGRDGEREAAGGAREPSGVLEVGSLADSGRPGDERRGGCSESPSAPGAAEGVGDQRQRSGNTVDDRGADVADAECQPRSAQQFNNSGERAGGAATYGSVPWDAGDELALSSEPGSPRPERAELPGAGRWDEGRAVAELREPVEDPARTDLLAGSGRPGRRRGVRGTGDEMGAASNVANAEHGEHHLRQSQVRSVNEWAEPWRGGVRTRGNGFGVFAPGPSSPLWPDILAARPDLAPALSPVTAALAIALQEGRFDLQAEIESGFCGLADGVARWLVERRPRLQCGGNGVVSLQAAVTFTVLAERLRRIIKP